MLLTTTADNDAVGMSGRTDAITLDINGLRCTLHAAPAGEQLDGRPALVGTDGELFNRLSVNLGDESDIFMTSRVGEQAGITAEDAAGLRPVTLLQGVAVSGGVDEAPDLIYLAGVTQGSTGAVGNGGADIMVGGSSATPGDVHLIFGDETKPPAGVEQGAPEVDSVFVVSPTNTIGKYGPEDEVQGAG
jgi:hypothetical protein